jgi:HAD superfamily hydrolase (TIGR01509 family)
MTTKLTYFCFLFLITSLIYPLLAKQQSPIKVIVFDFGGVIAKTDKNDVVRYAAQSLNMTESDAEKAIDQLKIHTAQKGDEEDFWVNYAKEKGIKLPNDWMTKLSEARFRALKAIPGMIAVVQELQREGYQTALLSNVRKSQAEIKAKLGFYELFNPRLFSYDIGVKKPHREAYNRLLSELQMPPQAVLFVDNKEANIEAAKCLGIDGILFVNTDQLIQELKKRGILMPPSESPLNSL